MLCTDAKPRPVPFPVGLVEKNGSNIRDTKAGSMPGPLSRTANSTYVPARLVLHDEHTLPSPLVTLKLTCNLPELFIASRALMHKLTSICSICTGSSTTVGNSAGRSVVIDTELGTVDSNKVKLSSTMGPSANGRGYPASPLEKVSIC